MNGPTEFQTTGFNKGVRRRNLQDLMNKSLKEGSWGNFLSGGV